MCVLQSRAEVVTHACDCSLKCLDSRIEFIYLIQKASVTDVNGSASGEALFNGWKYFWLINHFKKLQTASVHHI